jgi:hypothetical protein
MGTIESSETPSLAAYLRSARVTTQVEQEEIARQHDVDALPADVRWSALTH